MIDSIHQSMINTALKCAERFRRRYIEGERSPAGVEAARGQGLHAASKINLRQKILTGIDLPLDAMRDAARDGFVKQVMEGVFLTPDEVPFKNTILNQGLNEAIQLTGLYAERVAPLINPVRVEEPFTLNIGLPVPLGGIMDFEEADSLGDLKSASKPWPDGRIKTEIQAKLYSYVFEKKTGIRPRFDYHVHSVKGKALQTISVTPTMDDYRGMLMTVSRFWMMVQSGVFLPADPGHWSCSEKWCQFHSTCPFVGNGQQTNWI